MFSSESTLERAWKCARLLSGFCYDSVMINIGDLTINKWDDVAGSVTNTDNNQDYYINTLGFSSQEYTALKDAIINNKVEADSSHELSDFAHMQYSLAARLAYTLGKDYFWSNWGLQIYTGNMGYYSDEEVSYFAGWLGDAVLRDDGVTFFENDDYCADLDAENIYHYIIEFGYSSVCGISKYYRSLSGDTNRAITFLYYIPYDTVCYEVLTELTHDDYYQSGEEECWNIIQNSYPDTFNFLKSLENRNAIMGEYIYD